MVKKYKILEVSNVTRILFNASVVIKEMYSKQTLCRDHVGLHSRFQFSFLLLTKKKISFLFLLTTFQISSLHFVDNGLGQNSNHTEVKPRYRF